MARRRTSLATKLRRHVKAFTCGYAYDFQDRVDWEDTWCGSFFDLDTAVAHAKRGRRTFVICRYSLDENGEIEELYDTTEIRL